MESFVYNMETTFPVSEKQEKPTWENQQVWGKNRNVKKKFLLHKTSNLI